MRDDVSIEFNPETQSEPFTFEETRGTWFNLEPEEDGGTPDSGTLVFDGNEATSTYFDGDTTKKSLRLRLLK